MKKCEIVWLILWLSTQFYCTAGFCSAEKVLCISGDISSNCSSHCSCNKITTEVPQNLANVNYLQFKFCSNFHILEKTVQISHSNFVAIEGSPTLILCSERGSYGIHINRVENLKVTDITLRECGGIFKVYSTDNTSTHAVYFASSIFIENSFNVTLEYVMILESKGTGLTMINNGGTIEVRNCTFENNHPVSSGDVLPGGVGLHIEVSFCKFRPYFKLDECKDSTTVIKHSEYAIINCRFFNNTGGKVNNSSLNVFSYSGWGRGGGMSVVVNDKSSGNRISTVECNFTQNSAIWGGGLYIAINGNAKNSTVVVEASVFIQNKCRANAGGGIDVGFLFHPHQPSSGNTILFTDCQFFDNEALSGGGVSFYSSRSIVQSNRVFFVNCWWIRNKATFGAALDLAPQDWNAGVFDLKVHLEIKDCDFRNNILIVSSKNHQQNSGKGTVWIEGFTVIFGGETNFCNNSCSALYILSAEVEFSRNSSVSFVNNSGFQGGAMAIIGSSTVSFDDDSTFEFVNNMAQDGGGAIFHIMYSKRDIYTSKTCFLKNCGKNYKSTKFVFVNNSGSIKGRLNTDLSHFGHSIYATTLMPCYYSLQDNEVSLDNIFSKIGHFSYVDQNTHDLSTSEYSIQMQNSSVYSVPGKYFELSIDTRDEFNNTIATVYHVSVNNLENSQISVNSDYTYISNDWVIFYGNSGDIALAILKTITVREKTIQFKIEMLSCPPGYVHDRNNGKGTCICSAEKKFFEGISSCNSTGFYSFLLNGYWVGYEGNYTSNSSYSNESDLIMSYCPLQHCFGNSSNDTEHALPQTPSRQELDSLICGGAHRTGILCSECIQGYVVYYHSDNSECRPVSSKCKFGWLLYILSDIVPVTLLFIAIIIFEVKLTSGSISGLILFIQISDTMRLQNNGFIVFPGFVKQALNVYSTIASMVRLSFFQTDRLSFCLSESASNMDVLAVKYLTIFYTLLLIVTVVVFLRYFNLKAMRKIRSKFQQKNASSSLVHGISGFLVLCYSESTMISLLILTPTYLYSMDLEAGLYGRKTVPFYDGSLVYFRGRHLLYALPALAVLLVVGILSPLLLLAYPLCYRIFACLRINESRMTKILCKTIPLEKCKPFFDSFQSSFKDDFRFFSGLYFVYRLTTLFSLSFISRPTIFYIILQVQFIVIALVHAIFQPHHEKWHSTLDALLFANLSFINLLTVLNQDLSYNVSFNKIYISIISTLQVILLYLPLLYFCFVMAYKVKQKLKHWKSKPSNNDHQRYSSFSASLMNAAENREKEIPLTSSAYY